MDLETLVNTPLPTLFVLVGMLLALVGFGLRFTMVIDVHGINPLFAKIAGVALLVVGLIPNIANFVPEQDLPKLGDPFLGYYLIVVPIIAIVCWVTMKFAEGSNQLSLMKMTFRLLGGLATAAVIFRAFAVYAYVNAPTSENLPLRLYEHGNMLPYFVLIGAGATLIAWIIFYYTREEADRPNRVPTYNSFATFCIYLMGCRLVWEFVDFLGRVQVEVAPT